MEDDVPDRRFFDAGISGHRRKGTTFVGRAKYWILFHRAVFPIGGVVLAESIAASRNGLLKPFK